ncbi:MAG: hypothetical protein ABMA14_13455, partial [Hyphomonadaceae bacterium]
PQTPAVVLVLRRGDARRQDFTRREPPRLGNWASRGLFAARRAESGDLTRLLAILDALIFRLDTSGWQT